MDSKIILGESALLAQALDHLSFIAPLNKPALIVGERGTGKELFAERLHFLSPRWQKPYLKVNCAAISESLLEAALFGHEAGAFTGAIKASKGYFERANEGTLFLDELGTISSSVQEKLLRVIEYGEFERLGGQQTIQCDVRIIGATNADLTCMANRQEFRADLLDRLAFDVINLPPLRFRHEDIVILAEHFAIAMSKELGREMFAGFHPLAIQALTNHPWPGNIRELKNVVQRSVYRQQDAHSHVSDIIFDPFATPWSTPPLESDVFEQPQIAYQSTLLNEEKTPVSTTEAEIDLKQQVSNYEIQLIQNHLIAHHYHQKNTAKSLGISYNQLRVYVRKHPQLLER